MDEMAMLLERFASGQAGTVAPPSVSVIEAASRRRSALRSLTSVSVVLVFVIALVIGLASVGLASESGAHRHGVAAAQAADR